MAENACTGECIRCSIQQQIYCAAQHGHAIMNNQRTIVGRLDRLEAAIESVSSQDKLINPLAVKQTQEADGAEE